MALWGLPKTLTQVNRLSSVVYWYTYYLSIIVIGQLPDSPHVIGDALFHRGRDAECSVDAAKVVEREPKSIRRLKVLPLFAEGIREPRHTAHSHAYQKVLSFDVRGANAGRIGIAHDWD